MVKNYIVPIDLSEESLKGLDVAVLVSTKMTINIQMVYVQKRIPENLQSEIRIETSIMKEKFEAILEKYQPKLGNESKLRYIIKSGAKIYEEVVNQVESYKDGIITMSTHGASGFEEFFIGSNAFKIISATTCPVIALRKGDVPKEIKKIVLPIDMMPDTRHKVLLVKEFAKLFNAEVHVIEVASSRSAKVHQRLAAYSKQVSNNLKGAGIEVKNYALFGSNIADLAVEYCNDVKADIIAIIAEQNSSLTNLLLGNYTQQILNKSEIPVLCITPRDIPMKGSFSTQG